MGRRSYATVVDYATWTGAASLPAGVARALAEATIAVDELLAAAVYAVDAENMPTDPKVVAALRDATCAQADYARALGDPNGVGAAGAYTSVSIGGASVTRAAPSSGAGGGGGAPGRYSPTAVALLRQAGLLTGAPCWRG